MLINSREIYNLAWLDSEFFDKEGFLLVKDNTDRDQVVTYVERFVRLRGNLLFILKLPNLAVNEALDSSTNSEQADHTLTDANRIQLLISYYKQNSKLNSDTSRLLFVLVLNSEFSLRRFDESTKNCGFIIEFHNIVDYNNTNVWSFNCLTVDERDGWIDRINRTNHVNLKSIFNLLLERKLNLIRRHRLNESASDSIINKSTSSTDLHRSSSSSKSIAQLNKSTSYASSLSILSNASTSSKESISKISTATSLTTQNNLVHQTDAKEGFKSIFLTDSYFKHRNSYEQLTASYSFTLTCDFSSYTKFDHIQPNIFVKVYCSLTNGQNWSVLGRTETLSIHPGELTKFAKTFYLNLYEKIELQNNLRKIVKFDLENNQILLKFNVYNLVEPFTERFILIGIAINYFQPNSPVEIFSSVHYKSLQIGLLKMTTLDNNEFNIFNQHQNGRLSFLFFN